MKDFKTFVKEDLTKTEKALLDQAHASENKRVSVTKKDGIGARERHAYLSLVKKGHLIHEPENSSHATEFTRNKARRQIHLSTVTGRLHPDSTYKPSDK